MSCGRSAGARGEIAIPLLSEDRLVTPLTEPVTTTKRGYRADVDGLGEIAVSAVAVFQAFPGIDIFLTIPRFFELDDHHA